ncbi:hypothetical protein F4782DRAFT_480165 [Xylaria castorea]|nr:hypothetical protein F4782DRAFT_480165 [Xylaria castorea]
MSLKTFETFFRKKTSIKWDDRIEKMGTTGPEHFQYQPPSGGKPVGLLKGHRASIFGGDDRIGALSQTNKKKQHNDGLMRDKRPVETHRKRAREEYVADDAMINAEGGDRPAKKSRLEAAEAVRVSAEPEADSARETGVTNSDCDSKSESEEDIRGAQVHVELISEEVTQDLDGASEAQYPLEFSNVVNDGTLEPVDYHNEYKSEHDSAGDYDTPEPTAANDDDGVAAPCNSEAGDERSGDEYEIVEDGDDAEGSDAPRENTEQEADDISKMYDEVQYAEIDDDDGEEDHTHDDDDDGDDYSPEAVQARRLAREISATAANIYYESKRGVTLVQDSQAELIDTIRAKEAYICTRAKKMKEREEMEDAEDAEEDEDMIDRQVGFGLDGSMDY